MAARSSLDLSEFFNDENGGQRFVDFIKKRQGGIRKQNVLFMDYETDRLSLEVQLVKLQTPELKQQPEVTSTPSKNKSKCVTDELPPRTASATQCTDVTNGTRILRSSSNRPYIHKSGGGYSPSDRLRRLSIKNSSAKKISCGKRILLQEFENTIESTNFDPHVCSTPISPPKQMSLQLASNSNQLPESENIDANDENCTITNEPDESHNETLAKTLQSKDAELKDPMENILNKTQTNITDQSNLVENSPIYGAIANRMKNYTFTVEKGSISKQLILTSGKNIGQNSPISNVHQSRNQNNRKITKLLTSPYSLHDGKKAAQKTASQVLLNCSSTNISRSKIYNNKDSHKQAQMEVELQETHNENIEIPNSSSFHNYTIILPTQNVEIPETQETIKDNNLKICTDKEQQVVVNSLNQITDEASRQKRDNNKVQNEHFEQLEDNLKLNNILTDDEDMTSKSILENVSETPLNLAASATKRKRRLRKRSAQLRVNNMQLLTESEIQIPPPAHSKKKLKPRRKCKPLNKAPGLPLNGEEYAEELARMSNYEILDLRKRNSMGQIFTTSDRRSRLTLEEVNKKKHELDDQIEQELLKRNLNNTAEQQILPSDPRNIEDVTLPVPFSFTDTLIIRENFIDEKSPDQIKFKGNKYKSLESKKKKLPEILKNYLNVSKNYSFGKCRKHNSNKTKRSLYNTHSLVQNSPVGSFRETPSYAESSSSSRLKKLSLSYIKSPPHNHSVTIPKIVSPPPPITTICEIQSDEPIRMQNDTVTDIHKTPNDIYTDINENLTLPPPPPGFESDTMTNVHNNTNQIANESTNTNNDNHLFKKPLKPAPKTKNVRNIAKRSNGPDESTGANQISIDNSADLEDGGSLRRSKRGRVPRTHIPILAVLYENELKGLEKRKKDRIKRQRQKAKAIKNTSNSSKSKISKRGEEEILPIAAENADELNDNRSQTKKLVKKLESTRTKIKKSNHATKQSSKEHMFPPSVEELNNIFDQLKQNSPTTNPTAEHHQIRKQFKIKSFKIRIRRLKSFEISPTGDSANSSSTSTQSNTQSNVELICWLKSISETSYNNQPHQTTPLKQMRISSATNLRFIELQGLEYAFYDTVEKASVGYLRFQPQQLKPRKKAKRFGLQFINLTGLFRININDSEIMLSVGDMVIVEKKTYYDIQNLSDDIGILMVIKTQ